MRSDLCSWLHFAKRNPVNRNDNRCDKRSVHDRQGTRSLRRIHVLAAIVRLVCWIAGHMMAALHGLLVEGHGVAVGGDLGLVWRASGPY